MRSVCLFFPKERGFGISGVFPTSPILILPPGTQIGDPPSYIYTHIRCIISKIPSTDAVQSTGRRNLLKSMEKIISMCLSHKKSYAIKYVARERRINPTTSPIVRV